MWCSAGGGFGFLNFSPFLQECAPGIEQRGSSTSSKNGGAVAGGVIGGLVLAVIVLFVIVKFGRSPSGQYQAI